MTKIATDLEQSKKLAKILPLDSADMYYEPSVGFRTEPSELKVGNIKYAHPRSIPAWSLSTLMDFLPIQFDWEFKTYKFKMCNDVYSIGEKYYDLGYQGSCGWLLYVDSKDLVDACVEMIVQLKEKELL